MKLKKIAWPTYAELIKFGEYIIIGELRHENEKISFGMSYPLNLNAERQGFEPWIPFGGIHTFQACSLNHSDISPVDLKTGTNKSRKHALCKETDA
jgi:hypothetical protein